MKLVFVFQFPFGMSYSYYGCVYTCVSMLLFKSFPFWIRNVPLLVHRIYLFSDRRDTFHCFSFSAKANPRPSNHSEVLFLFLSLLSYSFPSLPHHPCTSSMQAVAWLHLHLLRWCWFWSASPFPEYSHYEGCRFCAPPISWGVWVVLSGFALARPFFQCWLIPLTSHFIGSLGCSVSCFVLHLFFFQAGLSVRFSLECIVYMFRSSPGVSYLTFFLYVLSMVSCSSPPSYCCFFLWRRSGCARLD